MRGIAHARVLFDDIVLSRLPPEPLLVKTRQLARLVEDEETAIWLRWELGGYSEDCGLAAEYLEKTGRLIDKQSGTCYPQPLPELHRYIATRQAEMQRMGVSGNGCLQPPTRYNGSTAGSSAAYRPAFLGWGPPEEELDKLINIRLRVMSLVRDFVGSMYCTLVFRQLVETCFERHRAWVDAVLLNGTTGALEEIPAIYRRLTAVDREAIIQALKKVWNGQPLAWGANGQRTLDDGGATAGEAPERSEIPINQEEVMLQFHRVIRELLRGKVNRNGLRRSHGGSLPDIRLSSRKSAPPALNNALKIQQLGFTGNS